MTQSDAFPFVHRYRDRHGRGRTYLRRAGYRNVRLMAEPGTPAFAAEYKAAVERQRKAHDPWAEVPEEASCVYFIKGGDNVKIGVTTNLAKRFKTMQANSPVKFVLLEAIVGDQHTERELHKRFAKDRIHGEWFVGSDDLVAFIRSISKNKKRTARG